MKDISAIKSELDAIKVKLSERKMETSKLLNQSPSVKSSSSIKNDNFNQEQLLAKCQQQEKLIADLKEQLDVVS